MEISLENLYSKIILSFKGLAAASRIFIAWPARPIARLTEAFGSGFDPGLPQSDQALDARVKYRLCLASCFILFFDSEMFCNTGSEKGSNFFFFFNSPFLLLSFFQAKFVLSFPKNALCQVKLCKKLI